MAKKFNEEPNLSLDFEICMRQFFGEKAYHGLADSGQSVSVVKKWFRKAIKTMQKDINHLDTTERHRDRILSDLQAIDEQLKNNENLWKIILRFFSLSSRFLGYDYAVGKKLITPIYYQTPYQDLWNRRYNGENISHEMRRKAKITTGKIGTIDILRKNGYTTFETSLVMNISEYEIKKIVRENNLKNKRVRNKKHTDKI